MQHSRRLLKRRGKLFPTETQSGKSAHLRLIACLPLLHGRPVAVVSAMISTRSEGTTARCCKAFQWGGLWMESLISWQFSLRREVGAEQPGHVRRRFPATPASEARSDGGG